MSEPKLALVHSSSPRGNKAYEELADRWPFVSVEEADVIVALGGDAQLHIPRCLVSWLLQDAKQDDKHDAIGIGGLGGPP